MAIESVPDVPDVDAGQLTASREDVGDGGQGGCADLALLREAATLLTARQRLGMLLLQLAVNPFDLAAYRSLGSYLARPAAVAVAACERVSASTVRGQ